MISAIVLTLDSMNEDVHRSVHGYGLTRLVVIVRYNRVDLDCRRANGIQESFTCNLKRPVLDESVKGERETSRSGRFTLLQRLVSSCDL